MARALGLPGPSAVPTGYLPGCSYWVLSWLTKYQSELEPPPGRTALTPVTWAPLGRLSRAQGDGPQEVLGVTEAPATRSSHHSVRFPSRATKAAACERRCMPSLVSSADT